MHRGSDKVTAGRGELPLPWSLGLSVFDTPGHATGLG